MFTPEIKEKKNFKFFVGSVCSKKRKQETKTRIFFGFLVGFECAEKIKIVFLGFWFLLMQNAAPFVENALVYIGIL